MASKKAINRSISLGQMLIPEKNASGSRQCCEYQATEKTITGAPQIRQNGVLPAARFNRFHELPPPSNLRSTTPMLISAIIARNASEPIIKRRRTLGEPNQLRNQVLFGDDLLRSHAPCR